MSARVGVPLRQHDDGPFAPGRRVVGQVPRAHQVVFGVRRFHRARIRQPLAVEREVGARRRARRTDRSRRPSGPPSVRDACRARPCRRRRPSPWRSNRGPTRTAARRGRSRPTPGAVPTRERRRSALGWPHPPYYSLIRRANRRLQAALHHRGEREDPIGRGDAVRRSARFVAVRRRPAAPGAPRTDGR